MAPCPEHEVANLRRAPGELRFEARVGCRVEEIWFRTDSPLTPSADAALPACLIPAMRAGGTLRLEDPVSPRMLRTQREFQAIQSAWSHDWEFGHPPLQEVEVLAPTRVPDPPARPGRVAAFFSGGVDSFSTVLSNPDLTDLIFVRGTDILPRNPHQAGLADRVEARLRDAAEELGLSLHSVETNVRDLADPLVRWETYFNSAMVAVSLFMAPLFERVLMANMTDHETQVPIASGRLVDQLWSTERIELVSDGGRFSREERLRRISRHPVVQRTLRVCWHNPDGAYNCGRCRKCLLTMLSLEALGVRDLFTTFPSELDLGLVPDLEFDQRILLPTWEDALDTIRGAGRPDLERPVEALLARGKPNVGLPSSHRTRKRPGPPPTIRLAVVVPAWCQARYMASAIESALSQEVGCGVGVTIVDDGCPDPETDRIARAFSDAHPDRVAYLRQKNHGVSAARNAGIRLALARWPHVEAIFPLDADNLLSPHTLAELSTVLAEHPEAAWASPALEFFGSEQGSWQVPGPYLPYRQLFANQCDTGTLIRRELFAAGVFYDETARYGFEDWELFLRATLAGFRGVHAGRCGFRYRRRQESMVTEAMQRAELLEAEIQSRHGAAYEPAELIQREHDEAPRFALVRCDRGDALLTSACDLEPRRLSLAELARSVAGACGERPEQGDHVPPITVLTEAAALERLGGGELATALFTLQAGLHETDGPIGLQIGDPAAGPAALALRASELGRLAGGSVPKPLRLIEFDQGGQPAPPLSEPGLRRAARALGLARGAAPLDPLSNAAFLERRHVEELQTTFPLAAAGPHRRLDTYEAPAVAA
jgi:glycosyltransferase involved in cell wall biosynthesis